MRTDDHSREAEASSKKELLQSTACDDHDDNTSTDHSRGGKEVSKNPGKHWVTKAEKLRYYLPLYKAAIKGDWETANNFFEEDRNALTARVTEKQMTALHVAIGSGVSLEFVQKLVGLMSGGSQLDVRDIYGNTPLHIAAAVGNLEAARVLVHENSGLPRVNNHFNETPLLTAAEHTQKDTIWYLLSETSHEDPSPFTGQRGAKLLNLLLEADFYDIALYLLNCFPELANEKDRENDTALGILARKPHAFPSGNKLRCLQRLLYHCICLNENSVTQSAEPKFPEGQQNGNLSKSRMFGYFQHVYDTKLMHMQTLEIAKILCDKAVNSSELDAEDMLGAPMHMAATMGIHELVEEIIKAYPFAVWFRFGEEKRNVFHQAVLNRRANVVNLSYRMISLHKHFVKRTKDAYGNNILHLAGLLGPIDRISGPALQMQRELQWFEEVEKLVKPSFKELLNIKIKRWKGKQEKKSKKDSGEVPPENQSKPLRRKGKQEKKSKKDSGEVPPENQSKPSVSDGGGKENHEGKTPREVFSENHKDLVEKGGQWMKDTASSCTLVATLVVGVVFAGALSPPGGSDSNGIPVFINHPAFVIYEASDALAMFASATSVLMFLGILTNRYAEEDFLRALPMRLCIGLVSLFFAILFMLAAFGSSLYLVLVHRVKWVATPIVLLACIPATLFVLLQYHLLAEVAWSTFGHSRFGPKDKGIIC